MKIFDTLKTKINEHNELKRIENEAYQEAKAKCDANRKNDNIQKAKEKGKAKAEAGGQFGLVLDKMATMGENYQRNLKENGGTMLKNDSMIR